MGDQPASLIDLTGTPRAIRLARQTEVLDALGHQVRAARLKARLTQRELAGRVGRARCTISNIEAGRGGNIPITLLVDLSRVLKTTFQIG